MSVNHEKEYANYAWQIFKPKRNYLRVIASIIFLGPSLILGSCLKGLGYISKTIRERHQLTIQHYTPIDRTLGTQDKRLDLASITQQLAEINSDNPLHQPLKALIIYAEPGTQIKEDPGILSLNPQELILIGAQLVHGPSAVECLNEMLDAEWNKSISHANTIHIGNAVLWKMKTVEQALADIPLKTAIFSFQRYRCIYVIE